MKTIVCFGDSNTHGYNAENLKRFDKEERWPVILQALLGNEYDVIEEGLSGRTCCINDSIFDGLNGCDDIYNILRTNQPIDLLIIMLGTNDTKERFGLNPYLIARGLDKLIKKAKSCNDVFVKVPEILIITPLALEKDYETSFLKDEMGKGCYEKSIALAEEFKKIADLNNCLFIDANKIKGMKVSKNDYIHLNKESHKILACYLYEYFIKNQSTFFL